MKGVLIVDDSETQRLFVRKLVEEICQECVSHEAYDARSAIRVLGRNKIDIIVFDLNMDGMDGVDFIEKIKQSPVLKKKRILIMSSDSEPEIFKKFDGISFIHKRSNIIVFKEKIREQIQN